MQKKTALWIAFIFSLIGALFSGYLVVGKYVTGGCVIAEGCAYFLGYPTCVYGLAMFLVLLALSSYLLFFKENNKKATLALVVVSLIGVLFSLYFSAVEVPLMGTVQYTLYFPTCVYGFVMYLIIFLAAFFGVYRKK